MKDRINKVGCFRVFSDGRKMTNTMITPLILSLAKGEFYYPRSLTENRIDRIIKFIMLLLILNLFGPIISACTPEVPIQVLEYGKMDASHHRNLLVILRGRGGSHYDFEEHGIIDEVRKHKLPFDIVAPDAHFGYYRTETLPERLKHDIINPARAKGYNNIWLAGFSMGGLGALFTVRKYPDMVAGVILVSPFLGGNSILGKIEKAGDIKNWSRPAGTEGKWQYDIWAWIKKYDETPNQYPEIHLGCGANDSMTGNGPTLLARSLKPENHFMVPGGHDYETFKEIWRRHMERLAKKFQSTPRIAASAD